MSGDQGPAAGGGTTARFVAHVERAEPQGWWLRTLKRLGAAADELEDAPLARKTAFDSTDWLGGASCGPQRQPSSVGWWWWVVVCWTPEGEKRIANRVMVKEWDGALWVGTQDCRDAEPTYERATLKAGGWWFAEAVERSSAPPNVRMSDCP